MIDHFPAAFNGLTHEINHLAASYGEFTLVPRERD